MNSLFQMLDKVTPGKKTAIGVGGLGVTFLLHAAATATGAIPQDAADQVAGYGYSFFGGLTGIGAIVKLAKVEAGLKNGGAMLLALIVGAPLLLGGCSNLTRDTCLDRVEQAQALKLGCGNFPDEADRRKCEASADTAIAAAKLGCEWGDQEPAE